MSAMLDTHTSPRYDPANPEAVEVKFDGDYYKYLAFTERRRFMVTNDLKGQAQITGNVTSYMQILTQNLEPSGSL